MVDVALIWKNGKADLLLQDDGLVAGNDLITAITVALFSDGRANIEDVDAGEDLRGWWSREIGSLLWLLDRKKITKENIALAVNFAKSALQFLIDTGIASNVDVQGSRLNLTGIKLDIKVIRAANSKYDYLWDAIYNQDYQFDQSTISITFA